MSYWLFGLFCKYSNEVTLIFFSCPSAAIKTTSCSADKSLKLLKKACHGKNSCDLIPTNAVFGDPCVGTYKYIEMNFYCRNIRRELDFV